MGQLQRHVGRDWVLQSLPSSLSTTSWTSPSSQPRYRSASSGQTGRLRWAGSVPRQLDLPVPVALPQQNRYPKQVVASNMRLPESRIYVMTTVRSTAGINKAEDAGRKDAQIRFVDALRGTPDRTVDPPCTLQMAGSPLLLGGRNRGVKQAIAQNRTEPANLQDLSLRDMARHERYPSNAAMRRTIHVMNVLRDIPRRRASLSMYSATSSSKVSPARTLLPEGLINGMDTHIRHDGRQL